LRLGALYWPIVVTGLYGLAWLLSGVPGERVAWPVEPEFFRVYFVVVSSGLVAASAVRMLVRGGRRTGRMVTLWLSAFICAGLGYASRDEISDFYDRMRGNILPSVAVATPKGEAVLRRAWDHHYRAEAWVNGVRIRMLVDTGASMVLLPYESVRRLGINPDTLDYSLPVTTANGKSTVAPIMLSSIKIGPIAVFDVEAAVAQPGKLKSGLLGMSFLDKLDEASFRDGRLILRN